MPEVTPPALMVGAETEFTIATLAQRVAHLLAAAVAERGRATMALAGGTSPRHLYHELASPPHATGIPWKKVLLLPGDERCVAPDHPDSNQRMMREALVDRLPVTPPFLPMPADAADLPAAAADYAALLGRELPMSHGLPRLDVVLLGLGEDGHTASLFPGTPILHDQRPVAEVWVPRLQTWRMSLTLPVLNAARHVLFLVTGEAKAEAVACIFEHGADERLPASLVRPTAGEVEWYLDSAAASQLGHRPTH